MSKSRFPLFFGFLCLAVLFVSGCNKADSHVDQDHAHKDIEHSSQTYSGDYPIDILCTTGQVAEILQRVGGKHVNITALMEYDVDPHLFNPRHEHVELLAQADAIFYSGLHLEGRMADIFVQRARTQPTYAVTEGIVSRGDERLREPPEFEGMHDPHVWHDVSLWSECVHDVEEILCELDPEHEDDYETNAHEYMDELEELHEFCRAEIAKIPEEARVMVTAHDAFGYFGKAYGLEVFGLKGISSEDEIDLAHQEKIQEMIIRRKIPAVFVESTIAPRAIEALIEPCRAAGWDLKNGGELYADALGKAGSEAATYTGMIKHNVKTIVEALTAEGE